MNRNMKVLKGNSSTLRWASWSYILIIMFQELLRSWVLLKAGWRLAAVHKPVYRWMINCFENVFNFSCQLISNKLSLKSFWAGAGDGIFSILIVCCSGRRARIWVLTTAKKMDEMPKQLPNDFFLFYPNLVFIIFDDINLTAFRGQ